MEQENLSPRYRRPGCGLAAGGRAASGGHRERQSTDAGHRGGTARSSGEGLVMGPERRGRANQGHAEANLQGEEPRQSPGPGVKPFEVDKRLIFEAWEKVRANKGAPGVDAVSTGLFEERLKDKLYKLWNRTSSGSYFPGGGAGRRDTEGPRGGQAFARGAEHGGPGGADRGGDAAGRQAGTGIPPGQLRLSCGTKRP